MKVKQFTLCILIATLLNSWMVSICSNNRLVMLVFASDAYGDDFNFIEVWQWNGSNYVLRDNFTSSDGSCLVEEDETIKFVVSIKFNDTLASSEAEAVSYTKITMNVSESVWNNEELNNTSCSHTGNFYWLKEEGIWNQTDKPASGVTYECKVSYQGYH